MNLRSVATTTSATAAMGTTAAAATASGVGSSGARVPRPNRSQHSSAGCSGKGVSLAQTLPWRLARAFLWEHSYNRLKLAQLLAQLIVLRTWSCSTDATRSHPTSSSCRAQRSPALQRRSRPRQDSRVPDCSSDRRELNGGVVCIHA
jgi:hypothetical protein